MKIKYGDMIKILEMLDEEWEKLKMTQNCFFSDPN